MKNWKELYDAKKMTSDEAVQLIKSNDKVVFQHDVGEPAELVRAMVRNAKNYKHVEISPVFAAVKSDPDILSKDLIGFFGFSLVFTVDYFCDAPFGRTVLFASPVIPFNREIDSDADAIKETK